MSYRLLIVEDDKQIREIVTDYFEDERKEDTFVITCAKDGVEAMDVLDTNECDLPEHGTFENSCPRYPLFSES